MERIIYRKTLDVHKNGIQFILQGFQTDDKLSRTLELSLMASGDTIDFPLEKIAAIMYVTTPNATEPSINECTIKDNKIIYNILPIVEEGITEMQIKLIETSPEGATSVLATPKFALEVSESNTNDEGAMQTTTFTALEDAIAKAKAVYDVRFLKIELDTDCMFRAYYADGTVYESDVLKELFLKGDALVSQSYAKGGTGVREGEDTDNSMYYSQVSKSASLQADSSAEKSEELLEETRKHGIYTAFSIDFNTGEIKYISPQYSFNVNKETGELDAEGMTYEPSETIEAVVTEWLNSQNNNIQTILNDFSQLREDINSALDETGVLYEKIENEKSTLEGKIAEANQRITAATEVDTLVSQGTKGYESNSHSYSSWEKWNSGRAVIDCVEVVTFNETDYRSYKHGFELPFGIKNPCFTITPMAGGEMLATYPYMLNSVFDDIKSLAEFVFRVKDEVTIATNFQFGIHVTGLWK